VKDESIFVTSAQAAPPAPSSMTQVVGPDVSESSGMPTSSHIATTLPNPPKATAPITPKASVTITQTSQSSTPTLKIRLPRLSAVSAAVHSNPAVAAGTNEPRPKRTLRRRTSDSATASFNGTSSSATDGGDELEPTKFSKSTFLAV